MSKGKYFQIFSNSNFYFRFEIISENEQLQKKGVNIDILRNYVENIYNV